MKNRRLGGVLNFQNYRPSVQVVLLDTLVTLWSSIERACPAEQAKALAELQRERDGGGCKLWQSWAANHLLRAKMTTRKARRNSVADERAQNGPDTFSFSVL